MIGILNSEAAKDGNVIWFEIPAASQGLVNEYLYSVIDAHPLPIVRKQYKDLLMRQNNRNNAKLLYPVSYNGEIVLFYKLHDNWRVGSTKPRHTINDLGLKEAILQDISNVLIPV